MTASLRISQLTKTVHREKYPTIEPTKPAESATGKAVVISGATTDVSFAVARGFAAAGASTVVLLARRQVVLEESATELRAEFAATNVWTDLADLKDGERTTAICKDIRTKLSSSREIDMSVLSAANFEQGLPLLAYSQTALRDAFDTNVSGNLNAVHALLGPESTHFPVSDVRGTARIPELDGPRHHALCGEKVIISISSIAAHLLIPSQSVCGSSKPAFSRLMRHLQHELDMRPGNRDRVNSVHPGAIFSLAAQKVGWSRDNFPFHGDNLPGSFAVWLAIPAAVFLKDRYLHSSWGVEELVAIKEQVEKGEWLTNIVLNTDP